MATLGPQRFFNVLQYSGSLASGASISGSAISLGYTTLIGGIWTSDSTVAACGLRVDQSFDMGVNWDNVSASNAVANNASAACSTGILGNAIRVKFAVGATNASRVAISFWLRPI